MLYDGCVQSHTFLKFRCDNQAFAFEFSHLRFDITLASNGESVGGDRATIASEDFGDGVPKSGLTVTALAVGYDEGFLVDLADSGETDRLLYILDELGIAAEEVIDGLHPQIHILGGGSNGGDSCDEVGWGVFVSTADTKAEIVSSNGGVEKKLLGVEFLNVMEEHRLCSLKSGGYILHITAFHNERLVRECEAVFCKRLLATVVDSLFESLAPGGENVLFHACIKEGLLCLFDGDECLLKLSVEESLTSTNGKLL